MALSPDNREAVCRALGVGLLALGAFDPTHLAGPVTWTAIATGAALLGALGLARTDWTASEQPAALARDVGLIALVCSAGTAAAGLPAWAALAGIALAGVVTMHALTLAVLVVLAGATTVLVALAVTVQATMPWEALATPLDATTVGSALGAGVLAGWAPAVWSTSSQPDPGRADLPVAAAGFGVLVLLAWVVAACTTDLGIEGLGWMFGLLVPAGLAGGIGRTPAPRVRLAALALAVVTWAAATRPGLADVWWNSSLPAMLGVGALAIGIRQRHVLAGVLGLALLIAAVMCWPGLPDAPWIAALAALPWVAAVWWRGLR